MEGVVKEVSILFRVFLTSERTVGLAGFMQKLDARVKVVGLFVLAACCVISKSAFVLMAFLLLSLLLTCLSRISLRTHLSRFFVIPLFSSVAVFPTIFMTEGEPVFTVFGLRATMEGLSYVVEFTFRVGAAASYLSLLILTTRFSHIVAALRWLRLPGYFVTVLVITHRYIIMLFSELYRMLLAKESRTFQWGGFRELWRSSGGTIGLFIVRAIERGERVQMAVLARGCGSEVKVYPPQYRLGICDAVFATILFAAMATLWWLG